MLLIASLMDQIDKNVLKLEPITTRLTIKHTADYKTQRAERRIEIPTSETSRLGLSYNPQRQHAIATR